MTKHFERRHQSRNWKLSLRNLKNHLSAIVLIIFLQTAPEVFGESTVASNTAETSKYLTNSAKHEDENANLQLTAISKIAPILGESALVDKETGRIFWQDKTNLFHSTVTHPYLSNKQGIGRHMRATILSSILWLALISFSTEWIRRNFLQSLSAANVVEEEAKRKIGQIALRIGTQVLDVLLRIPRFDDSFLVLTAFLYLVESYTCSTRRYLDNSMSSPDEVEEYIEKLRKQKPAVKWNVRCFHYEKNKFLSFIFLVDLFSWISRALKEMRNENDDTSINISSDGESLRGSTFVRKVVTHRSSKEYEFDSWEDDTVAGLWKRAQATTAPTAQFTKLSLSKVLLFTDDKARESYFSQQSNFVTREGQKDSYAEFSTSIIVEGFKPKLLAVRSVDGTPSMKIFSAKLFWIFTLIGLTVPYRIWFSRHCDELRVTLVKETSAVAKKVPRFKSSNLWFSPPKTWFGGATLEDNLKEKGEIFRKRMQEISLYQTAKRNVETLANKNSVENEEVENATMDDLPSEIDSCINGTKLSDFLEESNAEVKHIEAEDQNNLPMNTTLTADSLKDEEDNSVSIHGSTVDVKNSNIVSSE